MAASGFGLHPLLARLVLLGGLAVGVGGCEKEEERRCGMGVPSAHLRYQIVDERTGANLLLASAPTTVGQQRYYLPTAGGDLTDIYLLQLSPADTDTLELKTHFSPLRVEECYSLHWLQRLEVFYNGRHNGTYPATGQARDLGEFYCNGCEPVVVLRKRS